MSKDNLKVTLIAQINYDGKVMAHEEIMTHKDLLTLREGSVLMEDAFSKIIMKAIPKALTKFKEKQDAKES
jgi:hypothetical protein